MILQKLPWAGIRIASGSAAVIIDPLYHFPARYGAPHEPLYPLIEFGPVDAVLITHEHVDHFDPAAIIEAFGAEVPVYLPAESAEKARTSGLTNVFGASVGDAFRIGDLTATAVFAVDGVGDIQVSWVVDDGSRRILHGGDTLWHGYWWKIAKAFGPFDAVCLPVNGAVLERPDQTPFSGMPITLVPEQAVAAAVVLGAKRLVPIHHTTIHSPPLYRQTENWQGRLRDSADGKIELAILPSRAAIEI